MSLIRKINVDQINNTISTGNSTTNPLGIGGTFTGAWEEITDIASIKVNVFADQDAADLGLDFQQSPDQSIIFDEQFNYVATSAKLYNINPAARYFRIVFTNGGVAQAQISIQTIYSPVRSKPSSHRLANFVTEDDDAELVKSVLTFEDESDKTYPNVGVQYPLPVSKDLVTAPEVWDERSKMFNFSGVTTDLFDNIESTVIDNTSNNPKEIQINFNKTILSDVIGLGSFSGNYSNTEIQLISQGGVFETIIDESSDSTKYTGRAFPFPTESGARGFIGILFRFHTTDTVSLSNISIVLVATTRTRSVGPNGLEYAQDALTSSRIGIDYIHHERHDGRAFIAFSSQEPVTSLIMAFRVEPSQQREPHVTIKWSSEETGIVTLYQGATWTPGTGTDFKPVNSYHRFQGVRTSILQGDASGAFVSDFITLDPTGFSTAGAVIKFEEPVWGTKQITAGAGEGHDQEQIYEVGQTYAFQIVCANGGAHLFLDWYEHIPKAEP